MWYGDCHVSNFLTFKKSNNNDDLIYLVKIIKKRKKNWQLAQLEEDEGKFENFILFYYLSTCFENYFATCPFKKLKF